MCVGVCVCVCPAQICLLHAFDVFNDVKQDVCLYLTCVTQLSTHMKVELVCL